jgi:hypothetical protein
MKIKPEWNDVRAVFIAGMVIGFLIGVAILGPWWG